MEVPPHNAGVTVHGPVYSTEFTKSTGTLEPHPNTVHTSGYQSAGYPTTYQDSEPSSHQGRRNFEQLSNIYQGRLLDKPTYSEYMSSKLSSGRSGTRTPLVKKHEKKDTADSSLFHPDTSGGGGPTVRSGSPCITGRSSDSSQDHLEYSKYSRPESLNIHSRDDVASVETASTESYSRLFDREEQLRRNEYRRRVEAHYRRLIGEDKISPDTASVLSDAFAKAEDNAKYGKAAVPKESPGYQVGIDKSVWKKIDHTRAKSIDRLKSSPETLNVTESKEFRTELRIDLDFEAGKKPVPETEREKMISPYMQLSQTVIESSSKPSGMQARNARHGPRPEPIILPEKGFYKARQRAQTPDLSKAQSARSSVTSERSSRLDPHTYQSYAAGILYSSGRSEKFLNLTRHFSVLERISEIEYQAVERKQRATEIQPVTEDSRDIVHMLSIYDFETREELNELYTELEDAKKNKEFFYSSCKLEDVHWTPDKDKGLLKKQKSLNDLKTTYIEHATDPDVSPSFSRDDIYRQTPYYQLSEKYKSLEENQKYEEMKSTEEHSRELTSPRNPGSYLQIQEHAAKVSKERPLYGTHIKEFPVNKYEIHVQNITQKASPDQSQSTLHIRSISAPDKENQEKLELLQRSDSSKESFFRHSTNGDDMSVKKTTETEIVVTTDTRLTGGRLNVKPAFENPPSGNHISTYDKQPASTSTHVSDEVSFRSRPRESYQRPKSCLPLEVNKIKSSVKVSDLKSRFEGDDERRRPILKRPRSVPPNFIEDRKGLPDSRSEPNNLVPNAKYQSQNTDPIDRSARSRLDDNAPIQRHTIERQSRSSSRYVNDSNTILNTPIRSTQKDQPQNSTPSQALTRSQPVGGQPQGRGEPASKYRNVPNVSGSLHAVTGHSVNNKSDDQKLIQSKYTVHVEPSNTMKSTRGEALPHPSTSSSACPPAAPSVPPHSAPSAPSSGASSGTLRKALGSYPEEHQKVQSKPRFQVKDLRKLAENNEFAQSKFARITKADHDRGPIYQRSLEDKMRFEGPVTHRATSVPSGGLSSSDTSNWSSVRAPPPPGKPPSSQRSVSVNPEEEKDDDFHNYGQLRKWGGLSDHINEDLDQKPKMLSTQMSKDESEASFESSDTFIVKDSDEEKPAFNFNVPWKREESYNNWDKSRSEPDLAIPDDGPHRPRSAKSQTALNYNNFKEGLHEKERQGTLKDGSEIPKEFVSGMPRTISGELSDIRKRWEDGDDFGKAIGDRYRSKTPSAHLDPKGETPYSAVPRTERISVRPSHYDPYIPPDDILKEVTSVSEGRKRDVPMNKPKRPSAVSKMTLDYLDQIGGEWEHSKNRTSARSPSRGPAIPAEDSRLGRPASAVDDSRLRRPASAVDDSRLRRPASAAEDSRLRNHQNVTPVGRNEYNVRRPTPSENTRTRYSAPLVQPRYEGKTGVSLVTAPNPTSPEPEFPPPLSRAPAAFAPPVPPPPSYPAPRPILRTQRGDRKGPAVRRSHSTGRDGRGSGHKSPEHPEPSDTTDHTSRSSENTQLSPNRQQQHSQPSNQSLSPNRPSNVPTPPARNIQSSLLPKTKLRSPHSNLSAVEQLGIKSPSSPNQNGAFRHQTTDVIRSRPMSEKDRRRKEEDGMYRKKRLEQLYEEDRQRKIRLEAADMEARKHSDFFTPSQKSPIALDRYEDVQPIGSGQGAVLASSVPPERRRGFQIQGKAKILYNFTAQNPREMSLRKGDTVYLIRKIDKNWLEGERHGRVGIFPVSYIEIMTSIEAAKMAAMQAEGQAEAKYNFTAHTSVELSLHKGEFVILLRKIDDNWYEGKVGSRQGIFPVSYVEVIREPSTPMVTPAPSVITTPMTGTPEMLSPASYDAAPTPPPQPSPSAFTNRSPTLNYGYRLPSPGGSRSQSSGGQLSPMLDPDFRSLPRSLQQSPTTGRKPASPSANTMPRYSGGGGGGGPSLSDRSPVNNHDFNYKSKVSDDDLAIKRYRALYAYRPQNEDELELVEGDEVYVSERCDDGWYVGTSTRTGQFGTFPGNYVQQICE